jgi:hypothetical protein
MSNVVRNNSFLFGYVDWCIILNSKKIIKLRELTTVTVLEDSYANKIFIDLLKSIIKYNIFDLSHISYLSLIFLNPYIDPHLKYTLYQLGIDICKLLPEDHPAHDYPIPEDKTISNILLFMINHIVILEILLNIHLFILYMHIYNLANPNQSISKTNHISNKLNTILSKANANINKSTLLLLVMKVASQIGELNWNTITSELIKQFVNVDVNRDKNIVDGADSVNGINKDIEASNDKINDKENLEKLKNYSSNTHQLLDDFIVRLLNSNNSNVELWTICKSHLVNMVRNGVSVFNICLNLLISYMTKESPNDKIKLKCIANSIINFLEMEITNIEQKLSVC